MVSAPDVQSNNRDLVAYFLPRTTFVVLIELFAFFFLNLYRVSLSEIKYFQNELTNIESRILAMDAALFLDDSKALGEIATALSRTERNFVLKKGESTVQLEQDKVDAESMNTHLQSISSALAKLSSKKKDA